MEPNKVLDEMKQLNKMKEGLYNIVASIDAGDEINTLKCIKMLCRCQLRLTESVKAICLEVMEKGPKSGVDQIKDMAATMGIKL